MKLKQRSADNILDRRSAKNYASVLQSNYCYNTEAQLLPIVLRAYFR